MTILFSTCLIPFTNTSNSPLLHVRILKNTLYILKILGRRGTQIHSVLHCQKYLNILCSYLILIVKFFLIRVKKYSTQRVFRFH